MRGRARWPALCQAPLRRRRVHRSFRGPRAVALSLRQWQYLEKEGHKIFNDGWVNLTEATLDLLE
eukprot:10158127-Lingulodinium_polyedra.AAC.1